ncbi:MAG TPA: hypothetical protein VJZ04_05145, partial [Lachnospiraceae bacterium]|nr:hypothetical protein [Lachnospiraceae bacterium]
RLNWTGHDAMIITVNNEIIAHAHNTFLQSAYDHGIATGIVFVLFGICGFFRSVIYMKNKSEAYLFTLLPAVVIIAFGICGMTEWIFHPSIPIAFVFLLVQAPLLSNIEKK